jgi:hypothetical protein
MEGVDVSFGIIGLAVIAVVVVAIGLALMARR